MQATQATSAWSSPFDDLKLSSNVSNKDLEGVWITDSGSFEIYIDGTDLIYYEELEIGSIGGILVCKSTGWHEATVKGIDGGSSAEVGWFRIRVSSTLKAATTQNHLPSDADWSTIVKAVRQPTDFACALEERDLAFFERLLASRWRGPRLQAETNVGQAGSADDDLGMPPQECFRLVSLLCAKALHEDDLAIVEHLLEKGYEPSEQQKQQILALQSFAGAVPSVFAIHKRFAVVCSKRSGETQPPLGYDALICKLQKVRHDPTDWLSTTHAQQLMKALESSASAVKSTRVQLQQAQLEVKQFPNDCAKQSRRDSLRKHHAECLRVESKHLLIAVGALEDEFDEPEFSAEIVEKRNKVQQTFKGLELAALSWEACLASAECKASAKEAAGTAAISPQVAVDAYDAWVHRCHGSDVVGPTDAAIAAARTALQETALIPDCSATASDDLAKFIRAAVAAVKNEEAHWASQPSKSFPCGPDLLAAGRMKLHDLRSESGALSLVCDALRDYARELADAEMGAAPESNRDPVVQRFDNAARERLEALETAEDACTALQRMQKRGQQSRELEDAMQRSQQNFRIKDSAIKEAIVAIAGICNTFPEVSSKFRQCLPTELLPLWMPEHSLSTFSHVEPLVGSSRNRVYKVTDGEQTYAIKEYAVTPEALKTCYSEAAILVRMRHPHIVELLSIFEDSKASALYLQFPFYKHGQLDAWVQREQPDVVSVRRILWQVVQALKHLHEHGIVHSDVKPANILIDQSVCAHLADFDVSADVAARTSTARATQVGFSTGFAAPELCSSGASPASDMFSFGVVVSQVTDSCKERDDLVDLLRSSCPDMRPTAAQALRHELFVVIADWRRDETRKCCTMASALCDFGRRDCRLSQGLECAGQPSHFVCKECLDVHVRSSAEAPRYEHGGRVHCPAYPRYCNSCAFDDSQLASSLPPATFNLYLASRVAVLERRKAEELEHEMMERLAAETHRLTVLSESERKRHIARNHIVEEILTLKCPRCGQAFVDFEGCFALNCSRCSCGFCAWCGADSGGKDAHAHVRQCSSRPRDADLLFGTAEQFRAAQDKRKRRLLSTYLDTLEDEIRADILQDLRYELQGLTDFPIAPVKSKEPMAGIHSGDVAATKSQASGSASAVGATASAATATAAGRRTVKARGSREFKGAASTSDFSFSR